MAARIFLCHASEDKIPVREVYYHLKALGFAPWLDEVEILPGQDWDYEIEQALETSDFVLVFLSTRSVEKVGYVQREFRRALYHAEELPERFIHTIPVRLDNCVVPRRFQRHQWVNLYENGAFDRIVRALHYGLQQRGQHVTTPYNAEHITTIQGISEERHERLAAELGVTRSALTSFFKILEQQQVPPEDLDHTLRQIATSYKDLQVRLQSFTSDDPGVIALKQQARDALGAGEFAHAEALLNEASDKDLEAAQQLQETAAARLRSAAASRAANGDLKRTQLAYAEAADYYRQAVELVASVPMARLELAAYLNAWGMASYEAGSYFAAEEPFTLALALRERVLGPDHPEVAHSLNNLAELYRAQGRYEAAEPLYERALALAEQVLGSKHPNVAVVRQNYLALLRATNRHAEADSVDALARMGQTSPPPHRIGVTPPIADPGTSRNGHSVNWMDGRQTAS